MKGENIPLVTYEPVESFISNQLKFRTLEKIPIILKESMKEYTSNERKQQNRKISTCNRLDLESLGS
jgi:hypothetical protein